MRRLYIYLLLIFAVVAGLAAADRIPADTIAFTATSVVEEHEPNNSNYCFTFKGSANGLNWKMQTDYYADSKYGTHTDTEFRLPTGGGSSTNWIRKDDGSYKTYYAYTLEAVVVDHDGVTKVDVQGLYREMKGTDTVWHYVQVHADILPLQAKETISLDLGQVAVVSNTFLGYVLLEAQNDDYSLAFGVSGISRLQAGTYYRAEMIRPDLVRKDGNDTIAPIYAQLEVRDTSDGYHALTLDLYSADTTLYRIQMHTADVVVRDTVSVVCRSADMQDMEAMYNIFQIVGASSDYQVALAVKPGVIHQSELLIPNDSIELAFTQVYRNIDRQLIRVHKASAEVVLDPDTEETASVLARLVGTNGTLYEVTFPFGKNDLPTATDTTIVDCGENVGRVDYTKGEGWIGLVLATDEVDVHIVAYNGYDLNTTIPSDGFDYTKSYVTTYTDNDQIIRFSDVQAAQMTLNNVDGVLHIALDAVTVSNHLYRFTAAMPAKRALTGSEEAYSIDSNDAQMIAFRMSRQGREATYRLQFQRADNWDDDGYSVGDQEVWDFGFTQDAVDGIAGTYGYAAGTLTDTLYHFLVEGGTEIYLQPMAGTLTLEPLQTITIPNAESGFGCDYTTHVYRIEAKLLCENNVIYTLQGQNVLLCVDYRTGEFLSFTEEAYTALNEALSGQGLRVRKRLGEGVLLVETDNSTYTMQGQKLH